MTTQFACSGEPTMRRSRSAWPTLMCQPPQSSGWLIRKRCGGFSIGWSRTRADRAPRGQRFFDFVAAFFAAGALRPAGFAAFFAGGAGFFAAAFAGGAAFFAAGAAFATGAGADAARAGGG